MYKTKKKETIIVALLAILFGAASLVNINAVNTPLYPFISTIRYSLIGISLLLFFIMPSLVRFKIPVQPFLLCFLWSAFSFFIILSGFANDELVVIGEGFWSMIGIPIFFFNVLPRLMNKSATIIITLGLLLGTIPYIFLSFLLNPIWQAENVTYSGIFPNSNGLGLTATIVSSCLFILLIGLLSPKTNVGKHPSTSLPITVSKGKFYSKGLIINTLLIVCLGAILLSNSRTSIVAFVGMSFLMFWKLFKNIKNIIIAATISIVITIALLVINSRNSSLFERIFSIQDKDSLSGRNDIWGKAIIDMKLLGNGSKYFQENFDLGAHNSIVHVLGIHGLFACLLIILFAITSFYYACLYFKKNSKEDPHAIAPLVFTTCFWLLSMGEGMFGGLGNAMTVTYMICTGVIMLDFSAPDNKIANINVLRNISSNPNLSTKPLK